MATLKDRKLGTKLLIYDWSPDILCRELDCYGDDLL